MKTFKAIVFLVVSCLLSTFAVAQTSAPAATDRLFVVSTTPDQWVNTEKLFVEHGVIVGDEVVVAKLAEIAHSNAKASNHPSGKLPAADFAKAFSTRNASLSFEGKVKINSYLVLAQGKGIFLPEAPAVVATAAVVASATPQVSDDVASLNRELKKLKGEIEKAKAEAATGDKKLADLSGEKLDMLNQQLLSLKTLINNLPSTAEVKALRDKVDVVLREDLAKFEGRLAAVEQNPLLAAGNSIFVAIGLALLLLLGLTVAFWRRSVKKIAAVKQRVEAVAGEVRQVDEKVTKVTGRVAGVEKAVGLLDIQIPDDLEERLFELKASWSYTDEIAVESVTYILKFTAVGSGMVAVEGIDGQTTDMRIENVRSRIKRAASRGHLVGVKANVDAGGFPKLAAVAA